jgi:hypothetical protein
MNTLVTKYNEEYKDKILSENFGTNWQQKLYDDLKQSEYRFNAIIKVFRPDLSLIIDKEPGMFYINMNDKIIHINLQEVIDFFLSPINIRIIEKYYGSRFLTVLTNLIVGGIIHEMGHPYVSCTTEQMKQIYNLNKQSIDYNFFHTLTNIIDDCILQNKMEILFANYQEEIFMLEVFGQGISSYTNYCNLDETKSDVYNALYYLILYTYKSVQNKFTKHYDEKLISEITLVNNFETILTEQLLHEFDSIKLIEEKYERTMKVYKFAEKFYNNLSQDEQIKLQLNGQSLEEALKQALEELKKDNVSTPSDTISNNEQKQIGTLPLHKGTPVDVEPNTLKNLKSLRGKFYDSIKKIFLEDDSGVFTNLKQGKVNIDQVHKESISNKVFKQHIQNINNPDLEFIFIIDVSGSMSNHIKFKNKRITLFDFSFMIAASLGESIVQNFLDSQLKFYTFSDYAAHVGNFNVNNFDFDYVIKSFYGNNMGSGTDPETVLQIVADELKQSTHTDKMVVYLTDGFFNITNTIKNNLNYIEENSLFVVINLTGHEIKIFEDNIVLSYDDSTITNLGEDMVELINQRILVI